VREGAGVAGAIAGAIVVAFATLPFVLVLMLYLAWSIYALVEILGDSGPASPAIVTLIVVGIVGGVALLIGVGLGLIGRSLSPKRRRDDM
jgi:hypothetical protein